MKLKMEMRMTQKMNENLFETLVRAASTDIEDYDPTAIIRTIGLLVAMGKSAALDALEEYLGKAPDRTHLQIGLFWILRSLFEVPDDLGFMPAVHVGVSKPRPPAQLSSLPRFPLMIVDDVPLLVVLSYTLSSFPKSVTPHLRCFRARGQMRSAPLTPNIPVDQAQILKGYTMKYTAAYGRSPTHAETHAIRAQLRRMSL